MLPPLYARWMAELLPAPIPAETEATCQKCAMCGERGDSSSVAFFNPATKCCTYVPMLPNFLVGCILDDTDPAAAAGRTTVERRIEDRVGVTPLGLQAPPVHTVLYGIGGAAAFGRSRTLRCPHYREEAGGACGIWRHRNGVCSTWFCKHVRGSTGQRFWQALDQLLATVERELARWCLVRLDVEPAVLARLLPRGTDRVLRTNPLDGDSLDGRIDQRAFAQLWGGWHGREREFYRVAGRAVADLRWEDVLRLGGGSVAALARVVASAHGALLDDAIPERLVVGRLQILASGRHHVRVAAYSGLDPLDLPRRLVDVLPAFDGRRTEQVLRAIRAQQCLNVERGLVRRLVDFGILVAADGPPSRRPPAT
jgi:hypothetical protein